MTDQSTIPDVDFSFVRYANCWEDARLLIDALRPAPGKRILSIGSAGDNALALIASGAAVVAVDLNPAQLACIDLRKETIRALECADFKRFCGVEESDGRIEIYHAIRPALEGESRQYWDAHQEDIARGFIHAGKFENYFHLFRTRILPLIHRQESVDRLLKSKDREARCRFYEKTWNNRRWRWLFNIFFSRRIMGRHGRDPALFRHVEGRVATRILERTRYALTELDTADNPFLSYILTGNFTRALPYYLEEFNYEAIRRNIDQLTIRRGAIDSVAGAFGPASFDGFNLSDIFEYLSPKQCEAVYAALLESARPHARLAYWNMLAERECPATLRNRIGSLNAQALALHKLDRAFFYSRFVLEEVL